MRVNHADDRQCFVDRAPGFANLPLALGDRYALGVATNAGRAYVELSMRSVRPLGGFGRRRSSENAG